MLSAFSVKSDFIESKTEGPTRESDAYCFTVVYNTFLRLASSKLNIPH